MPMMEEAAQWLVELGQSSEWSADWDWLSVAVFQCSKTCDREQNELRDGHLAELIVAIAND